jgi:hypothetical protein
MARNTTAVVMPGRLRPTHSAGCFPNGLAGWHDLQSLLCKRKGNVGDETGVLFVTITRTEVVRRLDRRAVVGGG